MHRLIAMCLVCVAASGCARAKSSLHDTPIRAYRSLPHMYYDQAVDSINALYPGHETFVDVRSTLIGGRVLSVYAYSTTKGAARVQIDGCIVEGMTACTVSAQTSRQALDATLRRVFGVGLKEFSNRSASPSPVASVNCDYVERQDYNAQAEVYSRLDRLAHQRLASGITSSEVEAALGKAWREFDLSDRVTFWSYAPSISGTFEYWLVFVDGRLDFFGEAQTTWLAERYGKPSS